MPIECHAPSLHQKWSSNYSVYALSLIFFFFFNVLAVLNYDSCVILPSPMEYTGLLGEDPKKFENDVEISLDDHASLESISGSKKSWMTRSAIVVLTSVVTTLVTSAVFYVRIKSHGAETPQYLQIVPDCKASRKLKRYLFKCC
jgi:hypothetical protein